jgi:V8-like Glu-specific endopeptidase
MPRSNSANDVDRTIKVFEQFKSRIALIRLGGKESGTGFLVGEKLLLTAQHVVEASPGTVAEPDSIEVTFDFRYQNTTSIETGDTVRVVEVVRHSPPTDKERSTAMGVDWEASDQYLDYAILQLRRRSPILSHGKSRPRGHYNIDSNPPRIEREQVLLLGHHPQGETIESSFVTSPELNKNETRFKYKADTMHGSSGGVIVNNRGQLVGLHHYASSTDKHGVPIAAVIQDLKVNRFDYLIEQTPLEQNVIHLGRYSTNAKRRICAALVDDWQSLRTYLGLPEFVTSADILWDWLALNKKLGKLRDALEAADRTELVQILDKDIIIVDQSTIDTIQELADLLVASAESAASPSSYLRSAMRARSLASMLLDEIESLSSAPDDDRAQLHWRTTWQSELGYAATNLEELLQLLPETAEDASFTYSHLQGVIQAAHVVQSTASTLAELGQNPELSTR